MHSKRVTRRAPFPAYRHPLLCPTANCTRTVSVSIPAHTITAGKKYLMFDKNWTTIGCARFVIGADPLPRTRDFLRPLGFSPLGFFFFVSALRSAPVSVFGTFLLCTRRSFAEKCFFFFFDDPVPPRHVRHGASSRKRSAEITLIIFDEIVWQRRLFNGIFRR